jgi:branched-chain amino acid transport system permease protein
VEQEAPVGVKADGDVGSSHLSRFVPPVVALLLLAILAALPLVGPGPNIIRLLFVTLTLVTASVGWNLIGGFAGQISFGFAVFYGLGAYTTALSLNGGIPPVFAFLLGAAAAAVASLLIGLPTFRLKGPYFAIATIGVSEAVRVVMMNVPFTGGASGYRIIEKGRFVQSHHYYTALVLAALAVGISILVRRSKLGLALIAIREDQDAASDLGVNPFVAKLLVHALAAALAGAAGGVYARYALFIDPDGVFAFRNGVAILLMPIIGGVGTIWGPVIGAFVYGVIHEEVVANFPQAHLLIFGSLLIVIILFEPGGVVGLYQRFIRFVRARSSVGSHS